MPRSGRTRDFDFPILQAAELLVATLNGNHLACNFDNMDVAFRILKETGAVRENFSEANRQAHHKNVEDLRAMGLDVQAAPDPRTGTAQELNDFMAGQPKQTPAPREGRDPFEMSLDELNALNAPAPVEW